MRGLRIAAASCLLVGSSTLGLGQEAPETAVELPLTTLEGRLPATAEEGRKAIGKETFGLVTINARALAIPVEPSGADDERLRVHADVYDYYFLPLTIGVSGLDGSPVQAFQVEFSLPDRRVSDNDIWIVDVFPRLETAQGRLTADAELTVSAGLELKASVPGAAPVAGNAKIDGKSSVNWKYNPVFQSFTAVFSEATAFWLFDKIADEVKAGPIDLRLLVAVRDGQVAKAQGVTVTSRLRATFGGALFTERFASTEATIRVEM